MHTDTKRCVPCTLTHLQNDHEELQIKYDMALEYLTDLIDDNEILKGTISHLEKELTQLNGMRN